MKFMWHSKSNKTKKSKNSSPHIFIFPVWIYANFYFANITQSSSDFQAHHEEKQHVLQSGWKIKPKEYQTFDISTQRGSSSDCKMNIKNL